MLRYVTVRVLILIPVLFTVSVVVFLVLHLAPGDPVSLVAGNQAPPAVRAEVRRQLHLDQPLVVQYALFVKNAVQGNFGRSYVIGKPVGQLLYERIGNTLRIGVPAFLLSYLLAIPLGVLAAARHRTWNDYLVLAIGNFGVAVPEFIVSLVLIFVFGYKLGWFPTSGIGSWKHLVLPIVALTIASLSLTVRFVRASVLEELHGDYVRTARAKGLSGRRVLWGHALRNALLPLISLSALRLGWLLGGTVVVEVVFGWPGAGRLLVDAVTSRDYPVIQGATLVLAAGVVLANLVADILYAVVDPRIRY